MTTQDKVTLGQVNSNKVQGTFFSRHHIDLPLLFGLFAALCFSLFVLYSASGQELDMLLRQITRTGAAFLLMIVVAQIPPRLYAKASIYLYIVGLILLILVELFGDISKGAQRWLNLGFIRIQPSEIFKVVMPLCVATFLSKTSIPPKFITTIGAFIIVGMPTVLILLQPDLGTASLVAVAGCIGIFIAGLSWWWIIIGAGAGAAALPVMWNFVLHDYQKQRVLTLIDPSSDPLGAGYHIIQSKIAIGSGGLYGKGWLQGSQSQLDFLPEPHTDFIFAVLSEETGLIGFIVLMSLYCFIIGRCVLITLNTKDNFERILCGSFTFTFMFYIFVNIGMVSGILPVVGVPLPLISYGGTAMITLTICFGMIMSIHTHKKTSFFRKE
ncbi:MAG: rod shape-determining protein RodA [Succinivibrio sp.]|nr:rod shape-determining protein RodA [Succinivibrio sp.]MCI6449543.1 rod shape-determining protein RodA [Succinivibrio sp.]MDD6069036.1 rod shape-determining protein RodA [Succinivibrio sp.]HAO91661.1 rod shape-determining protein RodA [Succinivibrio sp.]